MVLLNAIVAAHCCYLSVRRPRHVTEGAPSPKWQRSGPCLPLLAVGRAVQSSTQATRLDSRAALPVAGRAVSGATAARMPALTASATASRCCGCSRWARGLSAGRSYASRASTSRRAPSRCGTLATHSKRFNYIRVANHTASNSRLYSLRCAAPMKQS